MPLIDTKLKNLKAKEKPYKVSDSGGLYIEVTRTGSRLWRMKYRFEGREKRLSFGAYPAISLADARQARENAKAFLAKDLIPLQLRRPNSQQEEKVQRTLSPRSPIAT